MSVTILVNRSIVGTGGGKDHKYTSDKSTTLAIDFWEQAGPDNTKVDKKYNAEPRNGSLYSSVPAHQNLEKPKHYTIGTKTIRTIRG